MLISIIYAIVTARLRPVDGQRRVCRILIGSFRAANLERHEGGRPRRFYVRGVYVGDMPRPEISEEVKEQVESLTKGDFSVPEHRVTFNDRLRILLERHEEMLRSENLADVVAGDLSGSK